MEAESEPHASIGEGHPADGTAAPFSPHGLALWIEAAAVFDDEIVQRLLVAGANRIAVRVARHPKKG